MLYRVTSVINGESIILWQAVVTVYLFEQSLVDYSARSLLLYYGVYQE
jgi:hypothetical protein